MFLKKIETIAASESSSNVIFPERPMRDLPSNLAAVRKQLPKQGYHFILKLKDENHREIEPPIFLKTLDSVASFIESAKNIKVAWISRLYDTDPD